MKTKTTNFNSDHATKCPAFRHRLLPCECGFRKTESEDVTQQNEIKDETQRYKIKT